MKLKLIMAAVLILGGTGGFYWYSKEDKVEALSSEKLQSNQAKNESTNEQVKSDAPKTEPNDVSEKANQEQKVESWNGQWLQSGDGYDADLEIKDENGSTFQMTLTLNIQGEVLGLAGEANVNNGKATYVDQWTFPNCTLDMSIQGDKIHINGSDECSNSEEIGKYFSGDYLLKESKEKYTDTLASRKILNVSQDQIIQSIIKADYKTFLDNIEMGELANEKYGTEDTSVLEGKTTDGKVGSIIIIDPFLHYYIGSIVGENKIKIYTNDADYRDTIHPIIEMWSKELGNYQVEFADPPTT
ncbi:hypothetical protein ACRTEV_12950 [Rossellomorea arthrocnemi]